MQSTPHIRLLFKEHPILCTVLIPLIIILQDILRRNRAVVIKRLYPYYRWVNYSIKKKNKKLKTTLNSNWNENPQTHDVNLTVCLLLPNC